METFQKLKLNLYFYVRKNCTLGILIKQINYFSSNFIVLYIFRDLNQYGYFPTAAPHTIFSF